MTNCKRFILAVLSVLLLSSVLASLAGAASADAPVFILSQHKQDKQIRIDITGDKLKDVYAFELKVEFDTKQLRFESASSSITGYSIKPIVEDSQVIYASTKIGPKTGDNGKITLGSLNFSALGKGKAVINLTAVKLVNSAMESVTLEPKMKFEVQLEGVNISFKDVAGHWAATSIERAVELGFVNGYTDGTFRPNSLVTRAEFAAMLARALSMPTEISESLSFKDTGSIPAWAVGYVTAAVNAGIITGYEDDTFRASTPIKRSEIAVMITRALKWEVDPAKKPTFADAEDIPAWAQPSVAMAAEAGILKGRGANQFVPNAIATRAEAVTLLLSLIDLK
ncbi:hypothetical protein BK133_17665 [Paenibacillus sp. FSL H8-0548]|uniref:S-layer homology domain-containing protein n=1 Tax=Paenibacillus sp. FSL H8-0548 TaxID=1920422 RepID=UPI00096BD1F0|nr:S-layer homology domain-containing protein [Paenibacillus sp. FSL H8-0548]OMF29823.1 hypothetical protein BK133_17665 [Paenibacillus sp. FSL H8-0548]